MRLILAATLVTALAGSAGAQEMTIGTRISADSGRYLTDADGRALYRFSTDGPAQGAESIACTGPCTNAYRPVLVDGLPSSREPVQRSLLGTVERPDGGSQLTYAGSPLYRYVGDQGQGATAAADMRVFGGIWRLVAPTDRPAEPPALAGRFEGLELKSPECVRHDREHDRYLVSNINGGMRVADNNGFITLIAGEGLAELKWIEGGRNGATLNAPKGMEIDGTELHVADIDHLRTFDLATGAPLRAVQIDDAEFLNDIAVAETGEIYVTDTGVDPASGAIFRIAADGSVTKIAGGAPYGRPNGIGFGPDGNLVVVTFAANEVLLISREGDILGRRTLDQGQLDGLVVTDGGTVLVSSWAGHHIARLNREGQSEVLVTGLTQPACFDFLPEHNLLLVPEVKLNRVTVVALDE